MRDDVKDLLENNMLISDLKDDLCEILDIRERIVYLRDLKDCLDVLIEEEFEIHFKTFEEEE